MGSFAQNDSVMTFNKRFIDAEDKWVLLPMDKSDTSFSYGFIYMDAQAGLTMQAGGTFKIKNGNIVRSGIFDSMSVKTRLQPNDVQVAILTKSFREKLNLPEVPDWLHFYKEYKEDMATLVNLGYIYNEYEAPEKALIYLEKAYKQDPHYDRLEFEMAFAYNVTKQYDKAKTVIEAGLRHDPSACLLYKELSYAYIQTNDLAGGEIVFNNANKNCNDKGLNAETAFNLASHYHQNKNNEKAAEWVKITKQNAEPNSYIMQEVLKMEKYIQ